jgi:hypothetical protein
VASLTIALIQSAVQSDNWAMTRHARERAGKRRIGDTELVAALAAGEILEDYREDPRGPSALVLGYSENNRAIHAVCALDPSGTLLIVTTYEPEPPYWLDARTRGPKGSAK